MHRVGSIICHVPVEGPAATLSTPGEMQINIHGVPDVSAWCHGYVCTYISDFPSSSPPDDGSGQVDGVPVRGSGDCILNQGFLGDAGHLSVELIPEKFSAHVPRKLLQGSASRVFALGLSYQ